MSIGIEDITKELMPAGSGRDGELRDRLATWEDLLTLIVDPNSAGVADRERKRRMLSYLLERAGIDEDQFWKLSRGQRGRSFLGRWSRVSRHVPQLELTSFDIDKVLKERYRREPLTIGSAWHHGFWRSYFSHAAITHPANDGLREEFSTEWDIARRRPAVLFATRDGQHRETLNVLTLDMPMIVGPLPHSDGITLERAYLQAIEDADPKHELKTRSLVVVPGDAWLVSITHISLRSKSRAVRSRKRCGKPVSSSSSGHRTSKRTPHACSAFSLIFTYRCMCATARASGMPSSARRARMAWRCCTTRRGGRSRTCSRREWMRS
jgi:hypothetical protein